MEKPKIESFCCPICGNEDHYFVKFVNAVLHWHERKGGVKIDFEHDIDIVDHIVVEYTCGVKECEGKLEIADPYKIKMTTAEPQ